MNKKLICMLLLNVAQVFSMSHYLSEEEFDNAAVEPEDVNSSSDDVFDEFYESRDLEESQELQQQAIQDVNRRKNSRLRTKKVRALKRAEQLYDSVATSTSKSPWLIASRRAESERLHRRAKKLVDQTKQLE